MGQQGGESGKVPALDPAKLERLAAFLPSIADRDAFREDLMSVSEWLNWGLFNKVSNPRAAYDELTRLGKQIETTLAALDALGDEAARTLREFAGGGGAHGPWRQFEPRITPLRASKRIQWVKGVLEDCRCWSISAANAVPVSHVVKDQPDPEDPDAPLAPRRRGGGRPRDRHAEEAMRGLIEIWQQQTGKRPGYSTKPDSGERTGPFFRFCEAVIAPIYHMHGMEPPVIGELVKKMVRNIRAEDP